MTGSLTSRRSQPPLALAVPLSRFTPRVGGGSAFFVRPLSMPSLFLMVLGDDLIPKSSARLSIYDHRSAGAEVSRRALFQRAVRGICFPRSTNGVVGSDIIRVPGVRML